jgi:hypothetical protein
MSKRKLGDDDDDDDEMSPIDQLENFLAAIKRSYPRFKWEIAYRAPRIKRLQRLLETYPHEDTIYNTYPEGVDRYDWNKSLLRDLLDEQRFWVRKLERAREQEKKIKFFILELKQSRRRGERLPRETIKHIVKELTVKFELDGPFPDEYEGLEDYD